MSKECNSHAHGPELSDLTGHLRTQDHKITAPRQAILNVLRNEKHPLTTRQILDALPGGFCNLATVYRSIHLLQRLGLVQRYDFGDGAARFELTRGGKDHHHHHLICTKCALVIEVQQCIALDLEQQIATGNGFTKVSHKLEFFGVCPDCQ
ncbi:MAG: Fur family transcriptional regulator [Verrucomicrobiota bacterium]|nr:Fur family transcriptional regulator [Verrucomicrobiota bacterium]